MTVQSDGKAGRLAASGRQRHWYAPRGVVENFFCTIKAFRRIAPAMRRPTNASPPSSTSSPPSSGQG